MKRENAECHLTECNQSLNTKLFLQRLWQFSVKLFCLVGPCSADNKKLLRSNRN